MNWCLSELGCYVVQSSDSGEFPWLGDLLTAIGVIVSLWVAVATFRRETKRASDTKYAEQQATIQKIVQYMVLGKSITDVLAHDVRENKVIGIYKLKSTIAQVERVIRAIDTIIEGPISEPAVVTVSFGYHVVIDQVRTVLIDLDEQIETIRASGEDQALDHVGVSETLAGLANDLQPTITAIRAYGAKLAKDRDAIFPSSNELGDYWNNHG